ncbi:MAG: carbon-nitrogen hydrolase family protein [Hyphomicrobiaceae bacterium]|nr:carbon-nitrogen hydrolase family protein [Hyphomicrobiaceae bacterium]
MSQDISAATKTMGASLRVALVQMCAGRDVARNVAEASALVREAAAKGARYVQTPEITTLMETDRSRLLAAVQAEEGNAAVAAFSALAAELGIWLHIGSMAVKAEDGRLANRSLLFAPSGKIAARFDKIHMFDVSLPGGETYRESKNYRPGAEAVIAPLPWGNLGMTICYDLRFPYLYRALAKAGADFLAIPASFTVPTGKAHWHVLMRARAIENGCFVLAAAQSGRHEVGRDTYGHSLVVSPWGEVIAEAGIETGVTIADLNLGEIQEARQRVPSLQHDREFKVTRAETGAAAAKATT